MITGELLAFEEQLKPQIRWRNCDFDIELANVKRTPAAEATPSFLLEDQLVLLDVLEITLYRA